MNAWLELLNYLGQAALRMLIQPYYYIAVLFIALYKRRQMILERGLIHVKLHSWGKETWRAVWSGWVIGIAVSLAAVALGISLTGRAVLIIWAVSLVLLLFRVRFLCFAYAIGIIGIMQFILVIFPGAGTGSSIGSWLDTVRGMDIPALLVLAALLHFAEALLVRWQGEGLASPLFLQGKRGKVVGGYQLQAFWPLPLFVLLPTGAGGDLPWAAPLGGSLGLISLPVLIGFSGFTQGMLPRRKAARSAVQLLLYSAVLLAFALLAAWWSPFTLVAALAALLLHEGLTWLGSLEERELSPAFVHPPVGRKVLAVLPGSPAEELGILPGEILLKVNGTLLTDAAQLHSALRQNPAFCKLEVQNYVGESKFLQRGIYDGDHHQLGIILVPEPDAAVTASAKPPGLLDIVAMRPGTRRKAQVSGSSLQRAKTAPANPQPQEPESI